VPLFASIRLQADVVHFLETLALLLPAGVPLSNAIAQVRLLPKSMRMRRALDHVASRITAGQSFAVALEEQGGKLFSAFLISLVAVGEQSGTLPLMLKRGSLHAKNILEGRLQTLTKVVGPFLIIIVGVLVAFIMVAVYLPIFSLARLV